MEDTKLITSGNDDHPEAQQHKSQCAVQDDRHRESKNNDGLVVIQVSILLRMYIFSASIHLVPVALQISGS
jgi:hypothetical protein